MPIAIRVALFSDSFYELNGVGAVSRDFAAYGQRKGVPLCTVRTGPETRINQFRSMSTVELKRGLTFALDTDLCCNPFFGRYRELVLAQLKFTPALIHITGPGDLGTLG